MKRIYLIIVYVIAALWGGATNLMRAEALGEWKVYPSYWEATQNVVVGSSVYSLMNGNLLCYDTQDESVRLYDCLNDLSDVHIEHIAYCQEAKRLVLVYDNQNIDLLDLDDNVVNIASLKDKTTNGKKVNSVYVQGQRAYLATDFGFLVVDVQQGVILDTYQLGVSVKSLTIHRGMIWICGMNGVYCTSVDNREMHSISTWTRRHSATNWFQIVSFGNDVFVRHIGGIYRFLEKTTPLFKSGSFDYLKVLSDGKLYFGNTSELNVYSDAETGQCYAFPNTWNDISIAKQGGYWVSDGGNGLKRYRQSNDAFEAEPTVIQPNSPCRDLFYRMNYVMNHDGQFRLLVSGGTNTQVDMITPSVAMYYENGKWTNFDESPASELLPNVKQRNTTDLVQDPQDDSHHFAGTWRNGLKEYRNGKLVNIYHSNNSPIRSILPEDAYYHQYEPATAACYDANGNLWIANQNTDTIIRYVTPQGKWNSLFYSELGDVRYVSQYLFLSSGINLMSCQSWPVVGIFAFDTNGTLSSVRDDRHRLITTIVNQDGTKYEPGIFYCMTEDMEGRIWCGTQNGLFVIDDPTAIFDESFHFTQVKIARNDGSGLADYLLNGVSVQCVTVDGGNRKWVGTESNGVYLISADGTELLAHFMVEDSPLLSNNVQCVAIHPMTGEVMIGTDKGLCAYQGDATLAETELDDSNILAFPNPVRPDYSGPIRIEGLTFNTEVKICSTNGQVVWAGRSNGGTCVWNGCNLRGKRVASGVYNVISNTEGGEKAVVTKIIVIH